MITDLVTAELLAKWPVTKGQLKPDVHQDVVKVLFGYSLKSECVVGIVQVKVAGEIVR